MTKCKGTHHILEGDKNVGTVVNHKKTQKLSSVRLTPLYYGITLKLTVKNILFNIINYLFNSGPRKIIRVIIVLYFKFNWILLLFIVLSLHNLIRQTKYIKLYKVLLVFSINFRKMTFKYNSKTFHK